MEFVNLSQGKIKTLYSDYEINKDGVVRNIKTNRTLKHYSRSCYQCVSLRLNGKQQHEYIHKLLYYAFLIDDIDSCKMNYEQRYAKEREKTRLKNLMVGN
jgi:hypothetical protein